MASEQSGSSSIAGKALGLPQQQQAPATSAALTAADPQISASVPGPGLHLLSAPLGALQQPGPSAFESAGAAEEASSTPGALTQSSVGPPMLNTLSGPSTSGHSQSTDLLLQPSTTSSALSGFSVAAGLQEAMQHMRLQPPAAAGPGSMQLQPQQPEVSAASSSAAAPASAPAASADHLQGRIAHSESQSSADIAQLLGQAQQHHAQQQEHGSASEDGPATMFFAKVPRTATRQQIQDLFAQFGEVQSLNLFTPYENSPTSKGCGLVVMRGYADAACAIAGLDSYKWEGMHSCMVVKLMPPQRQRQEHLVGQEGAAGVAGSHRSPGQASSSRMAAAPMARSSNYSPSGQLRMVMGVDVPPPGCAPNAYKLFVGNIPRAYAEADLLPIFESIGPVRELVVLRDRETQESKGSAFVWYATGEDADKAQVSFNMQLVLQNRAGASSRPLVVRRAAPSKQGQMSGLGGGTVGVTYPAHMQQAYAVAGPQGTVLAPRSPSGYGEVGRPPSQGGSAYAPGSVAVQGGPSWAGAAAAQGSPAQYYYSAPYDPQGGQIAVVQQGAYLQQQQVQVSPQVQQPQQQASPQQQYWQQQQQMPAVVHCQPQVAQYAAPVLLPVSEGPSAAYTPVLQVQQGTWQPQMQQQQQQPAYVATAYDLSQVAGAGGIAVSGALAYTGVEYAAQPPPQQPGMAAAVVSSVPQAVPAGQPLSGGGMVQQAGGPILAASMSPARSMVLSGTAASGSSSNVGPVATYQQLGSQHHNLIIPLSGEQLSMINSQLQSVMAMSGTSITAEHNFACGSLALNVVAASRQQLNAAWQMIQGLLGQQSGAAPQMAEGMM